MNLKPNKLEYFSYTFLAIVYISYTNEVYLDTRFAAEDGFIEWLTALMLLASSITLLTKTIKLWTAKAASWKFGMIILIFLFFFGTGEEISWGQRIFNIESSTFFIQNNLQQEINLHNLILGGISINKLIFGKAIFLTLLIYILMLPLAYLFYNRVQRFVDDFAIPIVEMHHVLAFMFSTFSIVTIQANRKWELYEFCFAFLFLLIFSNPFNSWIYKDKISTVFNALDSLQLFFRIHYYTCKMN